MFIAIEVVVAVLVKGSSSILEDDSESVMGLTLSLDVFIVLGNRKGCEAGYDILKAHVESRCRCRWTRLLLLDDRWSRLLLLDDRWVRLLLPECIERIS